MKLSIIILTVLLFSCSEDSETQFSVSSELSHYVDSFYLEASMRGVNPPKVNLISELGQCQSMTEISKDGTQWVFKFDKEAFDTMAAEGNTNNKIESLIFHDLGRIILGRELSTGNSIMNGNVKVTGYSDEQRSALLDELFK